MKVKSIIAALLLMVAGLQTAQAQKMVVTMTDNQVVKYNLNKVKDVTFEEALPVEVPEYVDLGLPSGTMWATTNIGASDPEEVGDFYAWGETETKSEYSWATYQYSDGSATSLNKYCSRANYGTVDGLNTLEPDDDAARVILGDEWSMPTKEQVEELTNATYTTWEQTELNGVKGVRIKSRTTNASIFLPIGGFRDNISISNGNSYGYFWTRNVHSSIDYTAWAFRYGDELDTENVKSRYLGLNIRPVCKPKAYVTSIVLSETTFAMQPDEMKTLTATVLPDNAENKAVTWKSSNDNVAEVNQNGRVLANGVGSCVITCSATDGSGVKAECQVTVTNTILVKSIVLSETVLSMKPDEIKTLTATVLPDNAENKALAWKSSDSNVASVNQNGRVVSNGNGTCVITCSATDGSGVKAECQIKVGGSDNEFTVNGVTFKMIAVEGGTFQMGSNDAGSDSDEQPVHQVTLSSFSIGETEVTQELWQAVMGSNPSYFKGNKLPVETVSWNDCQTFITKLNELTGKTFRLPTEAEWEYAARGGNQSKGYIYSGSITIDDVAWYNSNSSGATHPVAQKVPNELGIYDMSGNVWERCQDWYGNYSSASQTNPTGPTSGSDRVERGGSWGEDARSCRVANRYDNDPTSTSSSLGFRLAL